mmetsp:Transcript_7841/g.23598  ORF Transcript_7841/g.23598 Transcript_7841/m.23598 type:complete len:83 (+) Transcript_7841:622-870(+)
MSICLVHHAETPMPLAAGRSSSRNADGACCCPVITWGAGMADLLARRLVACHAMPPLRPDALDLRGNTQQHICAAAISCRVA